LISEAQCRLGSAYRKFGLLCGIGLGTRGATARRGVQRISPQKIRTARKGLGEGIRESAEKWEAFRCALPEDRSIAGHIEGDFFDPVPEGRVLANKGNKQKDKKET
jgi:hypothetical protein